MLQLVPLTIVDGVVPYTDWQYEVTSSGTVYFLVCTVFCKMNSQVLSVQPSSAESVGQRRFQQQIVRKCVSASGPSLCKATQWTIKLLS